MIGLLSRTLAIAALVSMLAGCQAMTGETIGQNIDDTNITTVVKTKLAGEKLSNLSRINVTTHTGVVTLNGVVDSADAKTKAEQITRGVDGVKSVNNNLQIQQR